MSRDHALRQHLLNLLRGGGAYLDFEAAIKDLLVELRGAKRGYLLHTAPGGSWNTCASLSGTS